MSSTDEKHLQLFIRHVTTAAANASLYQLEHQQVLNLSLKALEEVKFLLNLTPSISLKIVENRLIYNDCQVRSNLSVERLVNSLSALDISYLQIEPGISIEELLTLVEVLNKRSSTDHIPHKTENMIFGRIEVRYRQNTETETRADLVTTDFAKIAEHERDKFLEIYQSISRKKQLNVVGIAEIVGNFVEAFGSHSDVLLALAPLRSMDEYVYTHSTNICLLNLAQAKLIGIEGPLLNEIGIAAMLHDVGKMFISPDILHKKGKLDKEEWEIMQQHPQMGAEYLLNTPGIPRLAVVTAYEHHIGYNGQGYPATPHNWQLNTCSYMTSISDVYDALRTRRSYKEPLSFEKISAIMLDSAGKSLHPELTRSFLNALEQRENCPH